MRRIRVSAVSYTNTLPFVYGLKHSGILDCIDLSLDIPSVCAKKLINDEADIGLVPVAALLQIPDHHIVSDFCIGASGPVNSVFIFSTKPIQSVQQFRLDSHSRTSNGLARVLLKHYWKLNPEIVAEGGDAFVEIGDRTFGKKDQYPFVYDLAEEWLKFTGLPFAFAVWTANKAVDQNFLERFNEALKFGLENRQEVLKELPVRTDFDLEDYLLHKIDYSLNQKKKEALNKFLDYLRAV
ncbi:menaquinone biosynthesis protein [Pedobacter sp. SYSU D00535]|uniref:menaquinone biosynthetic enzyme MqnA/MqnD family protein n=1 Tax=Pedobacter sp. SYSU D00535 TaxID=2810308 RepID=UPI001A966196